MNISSSIINHRLYFTHKLLIKLPHLDCFFPSGSTEHVNSLLGRRFKKRWHSCYVSPSRMGPDRNGRPKGNRKCLLQMCFYIHVSGLLSLASSHLSFFSWHPQAPLTTAESIGGMMKVITSLTENESGTLLDWEGKNIPWWIRNSSCVSFTHLKFGIYFHFFVCGLSEKNVSNSYSSCL